jgi:8-oxo-dGTP diphosphatase
VNIVDVVGAVIANERGDILCALRSPTMSLPNLWEFPGGKIEQGESPEESLRREILEELGCTIEVGKMIADTQYAYPFAIIHLITYKARIKEGTPQAREHSTIEWVPVPQLVAYNWAPADMPTVEKLMAWYHDRE